MILKTLARKFVNSIRVYALLSRVRLVAMFLLRKPHEADFAIFSKFDEPAGTFVDIGANFGQAAVSFAACNRSYRIISFEPNRLLGPELGFVRKLLGQRFEFHLSGLGEEKGVFNLYVPFTGRLPLVPRASLLQEVVEEFLESDEVRGYGKKMRIEKVAVAVAVFDDLGIRPDIVKIDVEGAEAGVLRGMRRTIEACAPVFLIEYSESFDACRAILEEFGYGIYFHCKSGNSLSGTREASDPINFFAVPDARRDELTRRGIIKAG